MRNSLVKIENNEKYMDPIEHFERELSLSRVSHIYFFIK